MAGRKGWIWRARPVGGRLVLKTSVIAEASGVRILRSPLQNEKAPIVKRISLGFPKPALEVRFLLGALRVCSSIGLSTGLLSRWLQVRVLPDALILPA